MTIARTGRGSEDEDISRETKQPAATKRHERLATKFGWGKFGTGKFSRRQIVRNKNL